MVCILPTARRMRRIPLLLLGLIGLSHASLEAQTCRGLAPLPSGHLQATGTGTLATGSHGVGVALVYDLPGPAFGGGGLGTTSVEALEKSSLDLGAALGYQIDLGNAAQVQLCPVANGVLQVGPNNAFESGVKRQTFGAGIGFTAGTSLTLRPLLSLVPAIGVGVGYRIHQAESSAGARLFRIGETYGIAHFHVGVVVNQNLSIRPSLELPLGLQGGDPALGLTLGYHFGRRPGARSEP
jgi:hypothetical protein